MIFKKDLRKSIRKLLEESEIFSHIRISGRIDHEGEELTIEYRRAEDITNENFYFSKNRLEEKVKTIIGKHFFPHLSFTFEGPNNPEIRQENYRMRFKRHGTSNEITTFNLLMRLKGYLGNKYLFRN